MKKNKNIGNNYFQTLDNRQQRTMTPEEYEINEGSSVSVQAFCLKAISDLLSKEGKPMLQSQ
jgi:hypothetical protein